MLDVLQHRLTAGHRRGPAPVFGLLTGSVLRAPAQSKTPATDAPAPTTGSVPKTTAATV